MSSESSSSSLESSACLSPPARRTVTFSPEVRVKRTTHLNNYSREEIKACWYRKKELKKIKDEMYETIDLVQQGQYLDPERYCTRGIEFFTPEGASLRMKNKVLAWSAVFHEQEAQDEDDVYDEELIAMLYREETHRCQVAAAMMGTADARSVAPPSQQKANDRFFVAPVRRNMVLVQPMRMSGIAA